MTDQAPVTPTQETTAQHVETAVKHAWQVFEGDVDKVYEFIIAEIDRVVNKKQDEVPPVPPAA